MPAISVRRVKLHLNLKVVRLLARESLGCVIFSRSLLRPHIIRMLPAVLQDAFRSACNDVRQAHEARKDVSLKRKLLWLNYL